MTTSTDTPSVRPSLPRRCLHWVISRQGLRFLLFCAVTVVTLIGLFYAVENWRGRRAWEAYRQQAEARGVILDYTRLIPPPIPDHQNFAMTPCLRQLFDYHPGTQKPRDQEGYSQVLNFGSGFLTELSDEHRKRLRPLVSSERAKQMNGDWRRSLGRDMVAIYLSHILDTNNTTRSAPGFDPARVDTAAAAAGILQNMEIFDPIFTELRQAAPRPMSRYGLRYEEENTATILLPHLGKLKQFSQLLSYRASAALALKRTDEALADINLILRLQRSLDTERTLISYLVRLALLNLAAQPIWEGENGRLWNDAQLRELSDTLAREDLIGGMNYALAGERGFGNSLIEFLRRHPGEWESVMGLSSPSEGADGKWIPTLMPSGWFFMERLEYNKLFESMLTHFPTAVGDPIDPVAHRKHRTEVNAAIDPASPLRHHRAFGRALLPALSKVLQKTASADATLTQLKTSLALERHYLAHNTYPETLSALVPTFLAQEPADVILGGPLHYQRTPDGRYRLYSLGWNALDDQGQRAPAKDDDQGDWVWSFLPE